jgi:hypothetical protein
MMPFGMISHILQKELGLIKKLACRVSKLLSQEHDNVGYGLHQAHPEAQMGHPGINHNHG